MNNSIDKTSVVTLDFHLPYLYDYAVPTMFIITLAINCVIIHVRTQPNMWGSTQPSHKSYANNRMLFAIAICHAQTFCFPTLFQLYHHTIGIRNPVTFCYSWYLMMVVMPQLYYTVSNILIVILSIMRYCCQRYPFQVRQWFAISNVIKAIACTSIFAVALTIPRLFEKVFYSDGTGKWRKCDIEFTQWSLHYPNGSLALAHILIWARIIFAGEVACIIIVVFNLLAIWECNKLASREPRVSGNSLELKRLRNEFMNRSKLVAASYCLVLILEISLTVLKYELLDIVHPYSTIASLITFLLLCIGPITFVVNSYISKEFCDTYKAKYTIVRNQDEGIPH